MSFVPEPDGWDEEEPPPREPSTIEVEITEPEIVGTLFSAAGEVLFHVYDRPVIPVRLPTGRRLMPRSKGRTGRPWRRLRTQVLAEEFVCCICGHPVDKTLPGTVPHGPTVEHRIPLTRGGAPLERSNVALAHRRCNTARGNRMGVTRRTSRAW